MRNVAKLVNARGGLPALKVKQIKLTATGFMPLTVEFIGTGPRGLPMLSVAHRFESQGDLVDDPDVEVEVAVNPDGTLPVHSLSWAPVAINHGATGCYVRACWMGDDGRVLISPRRIKDIRSFLNMWDQNIRDQFANAFKAGKG